MEDKAKIVWEKGGLRIVKVCENWPDHYVVEEMFEDALGHNSWKRIDTIRRRGVRDQNRWIWIFFNSLYSNNKND